MSPHSTATFGTNAVDWENRISFDRLRSERLARLRAELESSDLGALLAFDFANIRYMSATHIGTWAMDKLIRFALVTRNSDPIVWDFGSAARHHELFNPWLGTTRMEADAEPGSVAENGVRARAESGARAGISTLRGAFNPDAGIADEVAAKIKRELEKFGVLDQPVGVDVAELPVLFALRNAGIEVADGQQVFLRARAIKTDDEISLLTQAASMVDAAYSELYEFLRPGVRENETRRAGVQGPLRPRLGVRRGSQRDLRGTVLAAPARLLGPPDPPRRPRLLRHPAQLRGLPDLLLPHVRRGISQSCPAGRLRACSRVHGSRDLRGPPRSDDRRRRRGVPQGGGVRLPDEEAAFGLQYGHGVGLSIWEKPIFSRLVSMDHPEELREGMFFAIETYWPSADGVGAARIEEEMVVTADGCEVVTKFPAEELLVAGQRYYTVGGPSDPARVPVAPQHQGRSAARAPRSVMRAAVYHGDHDVRITEVPDPEPRDGEVLLRVLRSGMCGTDATEWKSGRRPSLSTGSPGHRSQWADDPGARVRR